MIVIVNYGLGNLGSIKNMLRKIGHDSIISSNLHEIEEASKLILPGVGAFDTGMSKLIEYGLIDILNKKVLVDKTPVLGICLGAQLMCKQSDEGLLKGLSWIDANVLSFKKQFSDKIQLPVPNMGWLDVTEVKNSILVQNLPINSRFYFVHSFFIKTNNEEDTLFKSTYGFDFTSGFQNGNLYGVQFHPEKSHKYGYMLLKNFASI
jgi:glutamine amidotransferase